MIRPKTWPTPPSTLRDFKPVEDYLRRLYIALTEDSVAQSAAISASVSNHASLTNLNYAAAGHTGFEPTITASTTGKYWRGDKSWQDLPSGSATDHATLTNLAYVDAGHTGFEPTVTAGTTAKYYRGDKTWQTLNQSVVAGLTTASSPTFAGMTLGTYTFPATDGTSNQVIKTNGSGTLSWTDQTGGGGGTSDHSALSNLAYASAGHTGFQPTIATGSTVQWWRGDKSFQSTIELGTAGLGASLLNAYSPTIAKATAANTPLVSINGEYHTGQDNGTFLVGLATIRAGTTVGATAALHGLQFETQENTSAVLTEYNGMLSLFAHTIINNTGGATSHPDIYGEHNIVEVGASNTSYPRDLVGTAAFVWFAKDTTVTGAVQTVYAQVQETPGTTPLPTITGDVVLFEGGGGTTQSTGLATHGLRIRNISKATATYGAFIAAGSSATNYALMLKDWNEGNTLFSVGGTGRIKAKLPTSATGLTTGELWNNGGVVNVV